VKIGAENRNKVIAAAALGLIAVVVFVFQFSDWFAGSSSSASTTKPTSPELVLQPSARPNAANRNNPARTKKDVAQSLDPSLRFDVLRSSEGTKYQGNGRNIFRAFVEPPPPPQRVVASVATDQAAAAAPAASVPPPPPPIELKFYGFATPAGGTKRIFLAHNEDVFIAKEGDIVDRRYKVVRISPNAVDILDVLSNNRQSIPLTQG
jgi:hypothetical protein